MCNSSSHPLDQAPAALERMQQTVSNVQQHAEEARRICDELLEACRQIDELAKRIIAEPESSN